LKVITTFSGGGVVDYAFKKTGATLLRAIEIDRQKAELYVQNHGDHVIVAPVQEVDPEQFAILPEELDLFWASPPCIEFSEAKKGIEGILEITAAQATIRHIAYLRPKAVAIENVEGYEGSISYGIIFGGLQKLGYNVQKFNLNAANYGTPQTRVRLYIVAIRSDVGQVPAIPPTHAEFPQPTLFGLALKPWVGWLEAVSDLIGDRPCFIPSWTEEGSLSWQIWDKKKMRLAGKRENGLAEWHIKRVKEAIARNKLKGIFEYIIDGKNAGREISIKSGGEPCWTLVSSANSESHWPRAFMVTHQEFSAKEARQGCEPCTTLTGARLSAAPLRAVLIPGANAGNNTPTVRTDDRPGVTLTPKVYPRGVLIPGSNDWTDARKSTRPSVTVSQKFDPRGLFCQNLDLRNATVEQKFKALIDNCIIVKFDVRMLARLQGLGDDYKLCDKNDIASSCIGNGVAVQVAQAIYRAIESVIKR
jgi:site-specific DNA-cytosine methylase